MGRFPRRNDPYPCGAVIFYGGSGNKTRQMVSNPIPDSTSKRTSNTYSDTDSSKTLGSDDLGTLVATSTSTSLKTDSQPGSPPNDVPPTLASMVLAQTESTVTSVHDTLVANSATMLSLLVEVSDLFSNVPYVKVVAGVVKQIIEISNQVRTNRERCEELVEKVMSYSRVVFTALLATQKGSSTELDDLKEDLLQIYSVLKSIYTGLASFSNRTMLSRLNRLINRDAVANNMIVQDRRLDTAITSFQLKSSIVLRTTKIGEGVSNEERFKPQFLDVPRPRLTRLRSKPQIMFGRDHEIETLVDAVLKHDYSDGVNALTRIAILGPGGIGKTSLALSVLHDARVQTKYGDARVFVSCEAASSPDRLVNELAVALQIKIEDVTDLLLDAILRHLALNPCILVLDNFETSWDPPEYRSDVELMLSEITAISQVVVMITLRGSQRPAGVEWSNLMPPLQPVDLDSASSIFRTVSQKLDHHAVNLIKAVDCVPLAVTLLANLAAVDGETTEALWARWAEESTAMVEGGQDRLSSLEASVRLSLSSPRVNKDPDAVSFLSVLACLPDGMSSWALHACERGLPSVVRVKKAVSTLRQNSLVFEDSDHHIRVLSPIRLYVCAHHPPSLEARSFLQDIFMGLASQGTSYGDGGIRKRLSEETGNVEAMLIDALKSSRPLDKTVEAVLSFSHFSYTSGLGTSGAISVAVDRLAESQAIGKTVTPLVSPGPPVNLSKPNMLPRVNFFRFLTKPAMSPPTMVNPAAVDLTLKLRGDCLGCWGQLASRKSYFLEAEEKFTLAVKLHLEAGDVSGQAYDLHNLGCLLLRNKSKLDQSKAQFEQAMGLHDQIGDKSGKAYDLIGMGRVFLERYEYADARTAISNALQIFDDIDDEVGRAFAFNSMGIVMQVSCNAVKAHHYFTQALKLNSDMGDTVGQAESLAGLACSLLLRSQFAEAKVAVEEALALRAPHVNPDHLHLLGRVWIALAQYDEAEKVLTLSKDLHEEMGNVLGSSDDNLYLAHISLWRGKLQVAKNFKNDAKYGYEQEDSLVGLADTLVLDGILRLREPNLPAAQSSFEKALELYVQIRCPLGQAVGLYRLGIYFLRAANFERAMGSFQEALRLHTQTGNIQGQAGDLNKISEVYLRQGSIREALTRISDALATHVQIGDVAGQGDDVYIQAGVFLQESRFEDAEKTVRKALDLHTQAGDVYGQARDTATLGCILGWQFRKGREDEKPDEKHIQLQNRDVEAIEEAQRLFTRIGANGEAQECQDEAYF
ncbi:hypothetical protein K443DRAFT_98958 [Laccaria amethystina LaAM-08-1]|uniref:AAA+ ATPase domain-containing protein n=1 Tax=Laccaria amethystina LaAM-08-1 TaxID=1095629 RepID=A0A0C9XU94_9AGAR|nr:hypothetical protein K443DRAFT_98958 [Laccaria amethystina LaAM-08-1]